MVVYLRRILTKGSTIFLRNQGTMAPNPLPAVSDIYKINVYKSELELVQIRLKIDESKTKTHVVSYSKKLRPAVFD